MKLPAPIANLRARVARFVVTKALPMLASVPGAGYLGFSFLRESYPGQWQQHAVVESRENILTFSAVFACIAIRSGDVSKLRVKLTRRTDDGIWLEVDQSPFLPVLRKPNHYQTRIQFFKLWITSKLLAGNTYVLKDRDERGVVRKLYILDPLRVTPLVAPTGDVYYRLAADELSSGPLEMVVPASEIIHDRGLCLYHPLVGVSALHACAYSATQGVKIQRNSATFFQNMSRPSGVLTAPGTIDDQTAARLKRDWEDNYGGGNMGRVMVAGSDLSYKELSIPAEDAQLIDQLKWTVEDVARAFQMPLHMIGAGTGPTYGSEQARTLAYYSQTLQEDIEAIELLLDEGVDLPNDMGTEFDTDSLLRMDSKTRAEVDDLRRQAATQTPNEARRGWNLPPKKGGDSLYLQQQNFSLEALAKRDAKDDPFGKEQPAPAANDEVAAAAAERTAALTKLKARASTWQPPTIEMKRAA